MRVSHRRGFPQSDSAPCLRMARCCGPVMMPSLIALGNNTGGVNHWFLGFPMTGSSRVKARDTVVVYTRKSQMKPGGTAYPKSASPVEILEVESSTGCVKGSSQSTILVEGTRNPEITSAS